MIRSPRHHCLCSSVLVAACITLHGATATLAAQSPRLGLTDAVERALRTHPAALAARAEQDAVAASLGEATAQRFPQLSVLATATRFQEPMIVAPLHAFDISRQPEFEQTLLGGTASLQYTLFDGGARGARIAAGRAERAGAALHAESTDADLIVQVTEVFLRILTARGVVEAVDRQLDALRTERDRVAQLLEQGTAARVELLRIDAAMAQAESDRVTAAATLDVSERELARLIDVDPSATQAPGLTPVRLRDTSSVLPDREPLMEQAEASNPQLQRAHSALESARAGRRAARAAWFPRLDVFGAYLTFGSGAGDFTGEWQAGARLSYPIFTGGARASAVARASALEREAEQRVRQVRLATQQGVDLALSGLAEARSRAEAVGRAVSHLQEVARIERLALDAGAGTQTDYLRAEADLFRSEAAYVQAQHAEIAAAVRLARAVGYLTVDWLSGVLENTP